MRVVFAAGMTAASMLIACGCSTTKMKSYIPTFGKSRSAAQTSNLANAPGAPQPNSTSVAPPPAYAANVATPPTVSMPTTATSGNLPVYPGTNYPQTPYAESAIAANHAAYPSGAPTVAQAVAPVADPYASPYGGAPAYSATPAVAANPTMPPNPYAPPAASPPAYQAPASPYAPQSAPQYAAQQSQPGVQPPASPYQQQAPYSPPAGPYNAAAPQGTLTR